MAIITISRGSYSYGKEVAEKVAARLNYECVSREIILEASKQFNVPEIKLLHAIKDAPSILDRLTYGRERYVAYIQAALLDHLKKDNIVYHGFAGHFLVQGITRILKVRIIADLEERIKVVMKRDGVSRRDALKLITKLDNERKKWSLQLYGIDTRDPSLYDLVIHIRNITVDDAVDIICHTVSLDRFQPTKEFQQKLEDMALTARAKAVLVELKPDAEVVSQNGIVDVKVRLPIEVDETSLIRQMKEKCLEIPGVKKVNIHVSPITLSKF